MRISLADSRATGFKKWSVTDRVAASRKSRRDDEYAAGRAVIPADPNLDPPMMSLPEQAHRPWLVPGVGTGL